jgi:hypothetical protein
MTGGSLTSRLAPLEGTGTTGACRAVKVSEHAPEQESRNLPYLTIDPATLNGGVMIYIWGFTPTDLGDPIWKLWSPEPIIMRGVCG